MRISDWSSDVCSSDLTRAGNLHVVYLRNAQASRLAEVLRGALSGQPTGQGDLASDGLSASGLGASSTTISTTSGMGAGSALASAGLRGAGAALGSTALSDTMDQIGRAHV